eukprot:82470-Amphidinium_carterae.1
MADGLLCLRSSMARPCAKRLSAPCVWSVALRERYVAVRNWPWLFHHLTLFVPCEKLSEMLPAVPSDHST